MLRFEREVIKLFNFLKYSGVCVIYWHWMDVPKNDQCQCNALRDKVRAVWLLLNRMLKVLTICRKKLLTYVPIARCWHRVSSPSYHSGLKLLLFVVAYR